MPDDDLNPVKNPNDSDNTDVYGCLTTYLRKIIRYIIVPITYLSF